MDKPGHDKFTFGQYPRDGHGHSPLLGGSPRGRAELCVMMENATLHVETLEPGPLRQLWLHEWHRLTVMVKQERFIYQGWAERWRYHSAYELVAEDIALLASYRAADDGEATDPVKYLLAMSDFHSEYVTPALRERLEKAAPQIRELVELYERILEEAAEEAADGEG